MGFERYDRIAQHYPTMWPLIVPGYFPILNAMQEVVRAHSEKPRDVLDLGCGPGSATTAVAPACDPEGMVTLVDGSSAMLEEARHVLGEHVQCTYLGDFTRSDIVRDACEPGRYDLGLCSFALHHLEDSQKKQTISHLSRALKPGGLLLLADEVATDRPAGWSLVGQVRSRLIDDHLRAGRISQEFWEIETTHEDPSDLPFRPARIDDFRSWMASASLAASSPVHIFGSALMVGVRTE